MQLHTFITTCKWSLILFLTMILGSSISSAQVPTDQLLTKEEFFTQLSNMGIDTALLNKKDKLSRYELTRLLNAVECQDCILPNHRMRDKYTSGFRSDFIQLPGKDFRDIMFDAAYHHQTNYYYCVASVGEKNYMKGYPLVTSPICGGNFCGTRTITKAEFYQTLVNLLAERIAGKYQIHRGDIRNWLNKVGRSSYEYKTFDSQEIEKIQKSGSHQLPAKDAKEFALYLKYCTFNPAQCGFRGFENIPRGVWPLAQINILIQEGIITEEEHKAIAQTITPQEALNKLYQVYLLHTQCRFDTDYDCDGIKNHQDSCEYTYNPSQADLDNDGIGDSCDNDIYGDGESNPLGLVDETGNINFGILKKEKAQDQTPLGNTQQDQYFFAIIDEISEGIPSTVKMHISSAQSPKAVEWDFGDMKNGKGLTTEHQYTQSGKYTIRAKITQENGETHIASTQIFIGENQDTHYALAITDLDIKDNIAHIRATSMGKFERFEWGNTANSSTKISANLGAFATPLIPDKRNNITLKAYAQDRLVAIATLDIRQHQGKWISNLIQTPQLLEKKETKIRFSPKFIGLSTKDLQMIEWNLGDEELPTTTQTVTTQSYSLPGQKIIIQKTVLQDGTSLISTSSIKIYDPLYANSYAVNLDFANKVGQTIGIHLQPKGKTPANLQGKINFTPQESLSKSHLGSNGTTLYYTLGQQGKLQIQSDFLVLPGIELHNSSILRMKNSSLSKYEGISLEPQKLFSGLKCDLDKDGIPDIYDDDLDGDGIKNLLGMISEEKEDCALIIGDNVHVQRYRQHIGICSLDNCPLLANPDQSDLNLNGIGDSCETEHCGNGNIDPDETCLSCPEDVGACISICGDGIPAPGETCKNCPKDIPVCVEQPHCGDGTIDPDETCLNCPQDVGACISICGDGIHAPGETCKNCPKDVPVCSPASRCGDGTIDPDETCLNCPQDVGVCTSICGDGIPALGETCKNCPKDILLCPLEQYCGNGKIDLQAGEQCDDGKNNGKNGKCGSQCTIIDPKNPLCGNGKIDPGEVCATCPQDVKKCTSSCGNGTVENHLGEQCDDGKQNGKNQKCSLSCQFEAGSIACGNGKIDPGETCATCPKDVQKCASACGNGILESQLGEECDDGDSNGKNQKCSSTCRLLEPGKPNCGNGKIDPGETCATCPKDVQRCASACGNGILEAQLGEECDDGDNNGKNQKCSSTCKNLNRCGNGQIDLGETCHNCPEDIPICDRDDDGIPDVFDQCPDIPEEINGIQDKDGCPEITPPCTGANCPLVAPLCNSCPCQYADFSNTLHKNDSVRAHLGDQEFKAHYSSSPFSPLKDFLEF